MSVNVTLVEPGCVLTSSTNTRVVVVETTQEETVRDVSTR